MQLLVATRNQNKVREIRAIFQSPSIQWLTLDAFSDIPEIEEDGATFEANAVKKASICARLAGCWALADDSGLEVTALQGEPGVHSARYAGEPVNTAANNAKLLQSLAGCTDRRARFCCVLALANPDGEVQVVPGTCEGVISEREKGEHGFGYDPLFIPNGHEVTFAEMGGELKNRISHRAMALKKARKKWERLFFNLPEAK